MEIPENIKDLRIPINLQSQCRVLEDWLGGLGMDFHTIPDEHEEQLVIYGDDYREFLLNPEVRLQHPAALCLSSSFAGSYLEIFNLGVKHLIYPGEFMAKESLKLALVSSTKLRQVECPGCLAVKNLKPDFARTVVTPADREALQKDVAEYLSNLEFPEDENKTIRLCLKEAVTNAIFHGYRESGTHERKYNPDTFLGLYDDDEVKVELKATDEWLRVSVHDNSGILGLLSVANSMDRHHSSQGLMDSRGRGLYLMHHMARRMILTVHKRQHTCVELYFQKYQESGPHQLQLISL